MAKYEDVCERVGSAFCPAVVERFGACGERLAGFIGMISGSGDRGVCCLRLLDFFADDVLGDFV